MLVILICLFYAFILCILTVFLLTLCVTSHLSSLGFTDIIELILNSCDSIFEELPSWINHYTDIIFNSYWTRCGITSSVSKNIFWNDLSLFTIILYFFMSLNIIVFSSALLIIIFTISITAIVTFISVLSYSVYNLYMWIRNNLN